MCLTLMGGCHARGQFTIMKYQRLNRKLLLSIGVILILSLEIIRFFILANYNFEQSFYLIFLARGISIVLLAGLIALDCANFRIKESIISAIIIVVFSLYTLNLVRIQFRELSVLIKLEMYKRKINGNQ